MRGSCAGKTVHRSGVFIFPVVKVKTHKFRKMLPLDLRFLCVSNSFNMVFRFSMVLQRFLNDFTVVFHSFTMVFNVFTMVFDVFTIVFNCS